tara:strand:- start:23412 stop:24857 length:1446 start_codon:yes stop_codon:yes gene_type:complete
MQPQKIDDEDDYNLLRVNRKLEKFLTVSKPIKVAIGGRGSGKSIGFGDILTMKMDLEKADVYCLREYQDSINDSVHRVFKGSITNRLNLHGWTIQENRVEAPNGAQTVYRGAARNPDSIQSAQGYKYSWFEEAHRASKASLDKLLPTILRNPGAECWFSANPQSSVDPFSQRFITPYLAELERDGFYEDDIHLIVVVNWRDNPWWNAEQEALRKWDYENRPRSEYNWIWEGKFNDAVDDAIIMPEWVDAAVDAHKKIPAIARGARVMGFDPADNGGDDKGVVIRHGGLITHAKAWLKGDLDEAVDEAFGMAFDNRCEEMVYDSIGVGAGVKVGLEARIAGSGLRVSGFAGGAQVVNPDLKYKEDKFNRDVFVNRRAQYYWLLRDRFENTYKAIVKGEYVDPNEMIALSSDIENLEQLKSELVRVPRKRTTNNNLIQILSKPEMKNRKIPSPGLADSCMMCFANPVVRSNSVFDNWDTPINN